MNSRLKIVIQVLRANPQQLALVEKQLNGVAAAATRVNTVTRNMRLQRWGKDLQWVGRQLEFRFTLPLLFAAGVATKFALDNEKALTRVRKVYGDTAMSQKQVNREVNSLRRGFIALSNIFGVHQKEVIEIGAIWAQAGAQGIALARATRLTLETMILGDLEAEDAARGLMAVMAQFSLTTKELRTALATLNQVENSTAINMEQLITVVQRAGGFARVAGVDIRHLAAMASSLVPAAGEAATAGNALKTLFSRILAPTNEAKEALRVAGIEVDSLGWNSLNATQRLEVLAAETAKMTNAQEAWFDSTIAGRFQVARLATLLEDIANPLGNYQKALKATADDTANLRTMNQEIAIFLGSQPQAFKILTARLQNVAAQIIMPLIPAILAVLSHVVRLAESFARLDPRLQQLVLGGLLLVAVLGPIVAWTGAFASLISVALRPLLFFGGALLKIGTIFKILPALILAVIKPVAALGAILLTAPAWILALAAAAVAAVAAFLIWPGSIRDALGAAWDWIHGFLMKLQDAMPQAFVNALGSVLRILETVMVQIVEWLSYLNPFARHSPSLVESVVRGIDIIAAKYASLGNIGTYFRRAIVDLNAFKLATSAATRGREQFAQAAQRQDVTAVAPGAGAAFDDMLASIDQLRWGMGLLGNEIVSQSSTVDAWEAALDAANDQLRIEENLLRDLTRASDYWREALDQAQDRLDALANTPLTGMRAFDDAIFDNAMQVKQLRLEMLLLEEAGQTVDDLTDRMAALRGEIEMLSGEREELIFAGAGSDVLGPIDEQISALEALWEEANTTVGGINAIGDSLEALERQGQILELQRDLAFDPLTRQIDQYISSVEEIPFSTLWAQITTTKAQVDQYTTAWEQANAATESQQAVVDALEYRRDVIQDVFDAEKAKLDELSEAYDEFDQQIKDMGAALDEFARSAAASEAASAAAGGSAADEFAALGGADWADVGGTGGPTFSVEGSLADMEKLFDEWEQQAKDLFGDFDFFQPVQDAWSDFEDWWFGEVTGWNANTNKWIRTGGASSGFKKFFADLGEDARNVVGSVAGFFQGMWTSIANTPIGQKIGKLFKEVWEAIKDILPAFDRFKELFEPLIEAVQHLWNVSKPLITVYVGWLLTMFENLLTLLRPIFRAIFRVIENTLNWIRNIIKLVLALINGDWGEAWEAIKGLVSVLWNQIVIAVQLALGLIQAGIEIFLNTVQFAWEVAWTVIKAVFGTIWDAIVSVAKTAWDVFLAAIGLFLDTIKLKWELIWNAIAAFISFVWNFLIVPIWNGIKLYIDTVLLPTFNALWTGVQAVWNGIWTVISTVWGLVQPVFQAVYDFVAGPLTDVWSTFKGAASDAWNGIQTVIGAVLRTMGPVVGKFLGVIASIAEKVPGLGPLGEVLRRGQDNANSWGQGMAQGGIRTRPGAGPGFVTNAPVAIVGEGRSQYPEWVIPTDPRHRDRALGLFSSLGTQLMDDGGIIGGDLPFTLSVPEAITGGDIEKWVGAAKAVARTIIEKAWPKFSVPNHFGGIPPAGLNAAREGVLDFFVEEQQKLQAKRATVLGPGPGVGFGAGGGASVMGLTQQAQAMLNFILAAVPGTRMTSGYRSPAANAGVGGAKQSLHMQGKAVDLVGNMGQIFSVLWANYSALGLQELIYMHNNIKNGQRINYAPNDHFDHVHAGVYDRGGYLPTGLSMAYNASRRAERVLSPSETRAYEGGGSRTFNFYGDLSFPNITDADDAEEFISNLEAMVD